MLRKFIFLLAFLCLSSCISHDDSIVSILHPRPSRKNEYLEIINTYTKSKHVTRPFETVYKLHVTSLTPVVMTSFNQKFEEFFSRTQTLIEKEKIVFFVSIFSPLYKDSDFSNEHEWFIHYQVGNKKYTPEKIVRLKKSKLWNNFFPYVTEYSREFLIYFNEEINASSETSKQSKILNLSNSQAKTIIHW